MNGLLNKIKKIKDLSSGCIVCHVFHAMPILKVDNLNKYDNIKLL